MARADPQSIELAFRRLTDDAENGTFWHAAGMPFVPYPSDIFDLGTIWLVASAPKFTLRLVASPKFHGYLKKLRFWGLAADATPSAKASHK